jgi:hypothetical protein
MYYSYVAIEYVATSFSPAKTDLAVKLLMKQLARQNMFLVKSELSITAYLFLVFYRSTTLQSRLFLKNIDNFLCK